MDESSAAINWIIRAARRFLRGQAAVRLACCLALAAGCLTLSPSSRAEQRRKIAFTSSADQTTQSAYLIVPAAAGEQPAPLVVSLHTWSGDVEQRNLPLEQAVQQRGWLYLFPDFRGDNSRPQACGSPLAQQDIIDAVQWVRERHAVDPHRIYLTGVSGGGHMTMLMAGRYPQLWAAASAWVGISDLAAWQRLHADDRYGANCAACCGGLPGDSPEVDRQYRLRSPLTYLHHARGLPLDLAAGVHDGHQGSVPVEHTLRAFNRLAQANGDPVLTDEEMRQIGRPQGRLERPQAGDLGHDASFGRDHYLRRRSGPVRVTIFEGGHEGLAEAAVAWLHRHRRSEPADVTPVAEAR